MPKIGFVSYFCLVLAAAALPAAQAPGKNGVSAGHVKPLPPRIDKAQKDRIAAADLVARGKAAADAAGFVTLRNGKRVRYRLEGTEYLTVALIDFSDVKHGGIPQPDRAVDNTTYWKADFSPAHYRDMLFTPGGGSYGLPSMRDFYLQQSSGRFTWTGQVSQWFSVSGTAAEYGANSRRSGDGGDDLNGVVYRVVRDTLTAMAANGYAGLDITKMDQVDRYDCDGDGIYNEPDGYIDHFAVVHAGQGEEEGGGTLGGNAIWSHRWYANYNTTEGPLGCKLGGYQLGTQNLWVGDYTIEPENGGVGVFAHEFGHDLGLPDLYDTNSGENGTGFWTLMSSGSWASNSKDALGDKPVHMGAWEKLVLGWLDGNLATASLGDDVTVDLGPAETATRGRAQALRVNLPDQTKTITVFPVEGSDPNYFYSTQGDNLNVNMTKALAAPVGASGALLQFRAVWNIETDWDYAYVLALVNGTWKYVQTTFSTSTNPNRQNFGFGITGASNGWVTVGATLPAGTTAYAFQYWTDVAVSQPGIAIDTIQLLGTVDNATSTAGWTMNGFVQLTNALYTVNAFHYYLLESRSYIDNDVSLCGAYNFLYGNWAERQCFADGLLISYRNSLYGDNNTSTHPGYGQILPVDAHPATMFRPDGKGIWSARWQTWDATFGIEPNSVTLSQMLNSGKLVSQTYSAAPVSSFFDSSATAYWNAAIPANSVRTAGSGLKIDILGASSDLSSYRVRVHK